MTRTKPLIASALLLTAFSPVHAQAAVNTWKNGTSNFIWDTTSANWNSPASWVQGSDAVFGALGSGAITLGHDIDVSNMTFAAAGYQISASGFFMTNAVVTALASNNLAVSIYGTNSLTFQGTNTTVLLGDASVNDANHFTGGTYVRSGTVILRAVGVSTSGGAYAVGNIEAIDSGATVQIGTLNDGVNNVRPADGQLLRGNNLGRLNLTGGTFDNNGDDNGINYPCPEGTGVIVNSSPYKRAVMKLQGGNTGQTYVFNGQIKDGGLNVTTSQGVAYQQNIDLNGNGPFTLVLGGSNSFTGFLRINSGGDGNKVVVTPGGTLGYAAPINCPVRQILMNAGTIDLNGTSQKVGYVYTGNNTDSIITNSALATVSTLTVCYNCTNLVAFNGAATPRGIRGGLLDDPTTGGTLALVKEGVAIQPIGTYAADTGNAAPNNYNGDTTVNNGILEVLSTSGISPNSAYRLNSPSVLQLDYAGTANVKQLFVNGVQKPNGIYGAAQVPGLITGSGTITVTSARGLDNTWNNASTDFIWNTTSANWTGPITWAQGGSAIFGATGAGTVTLGEDIDVVNMTFNSPGYSIVAASHFTTNEAVTASAGTSNALALSIWGTKGMTFQGPGTTILLGDTTVGDANHYTGGTRIKGGKVILQAASAGTSSGSAYAVDSIEALDSGATLVIPGVFNGSTWGNDRDQIAVNGQLAPAVSHLIMTGGTLDLYNDPKQQRLPIPDGSGRIVNSGSTCQAGVTMLSDGQDHAFSGVIADGNNGVLNGDNSGQGPGYQIGIVTFAGRMPGTSGSTVWTLSGSNTYSGSTRIDQGASIKLVGAGTIGFPTPNGLTGPLRIYGGYLDLNGHNQTIANIQSGDANGRIFNSAVGTVSTLTFGFGNEATSRTAIEQFIDNPGTGGILALKKVGHGNPQTFSGVNTYSGDTTITDGTLIMSTTTAVSPNSAFRLSTSAGTLNLTYSGTANVRQLWLDGVQKPNGTYGAADTTAITGPGTLTVTGFAPATLGFSKSGNSLSFSWAGVYKLQAKTNTLTGPWFDYPGGTVSPVSAPLDQSKGSVFFRLSPY